MAGGLLDGRKERMSDKISEGSRSGKLKGWCKEVRVPFKIRLRAVLEGMSKIIEEGPEWDTSTSTQQVRLRQDASGEKPEAKRLRTGEPGNSIVDLAPEPSEEDQQNFHEPSSKAKVAPSVHVQPGEHVRTKDWYHEVSSEAKVAKEKKATKSDDAAVPVYLWNDRITDELFGPSACPVLVARAT
eukprot:scaffold121026_cov65-Attheya_sp.AAC.1